MKWPWFSFRRRLAETTEQVRGAAHGARKAQVKLVAKSEHDRVRSQQARQALIRMGEEAMLTLKRLEEQRQ